MNTSMYHAVESAAEEFPFLVHAKNILARKARKDNIDVLDSIVPRYVEYITDNRVKGFGADIIRMRVAALNRYYNYLHTNGYDNVYSAQTKFRPTILEEFLAILFRDLIQAVANDEHSDRLNLGSVKAYANLYFYGRDFRAFVRNPTIGLNLKDQDFAIFRNVDIQVDGNKPVCASLPIVAVECKTFIDKTMLEGSVATAEKIKAGNPYTLFCMVSELYDVSMEVDPAYSRIDQIYILRKNTRRGPWKDIDADVVIDFVETVREHLTRPWSDIARKLSEYGKLI